MFENDNVKKGLDAGSKYAIPYILTKILEEDKRACYDSGDMKEYKILSEKRDYILAITNEMQERLNK